MCENVKMKNYKNEPARLHEWRPRRFAKAGKISKNEVNQSILE